MGFEEGIGFIPFAGIGYEVFKTVTKNDSSPLRAAVLGAIALRGDPSLLPKISPALDDEKDVWRKRRGCGKEDWEGRVAEPEWRTSPWRT